MQADPNRISASSAAEHRDREWANEEVSADGVDGPARRDAAKHRLARLARTIEADVIPRLVQAHRSGAANPQPGSAAPQQRDIDKFLKQIVTGSEPETLALIEDLRERGVSVESLYIDLFGPVARRLGEMWDDDACDFSTVTVALGRLQRLLRELSPALAPKSSTRRTAAARCSCSHATSNTASVFPWSRSSFDAMAGTSSAVSAAPSPAR